MKHLVQQTTLSQSRHFRCAFLHDLLLTWATTFTCPFQVFCEPQTLAAVEEAVENAPPDLKLSIKSAEVAYIPNDRSPSVDEEVKAGVKELVEDLEEIDDVARVWTSLD